MPLEYPITPGEPSGYTASLRPLPPFRKRWKSAEGRLKVTFQHSINLNKEQFYMKMLKEVKQLYATLNERVYERDEREDNTRSPFAMHIFITGHFFFELVCDFSYHYVVSYDIGPGPFEVEITTLLNQYRGALEPVHVKKEPDLLTHLKNVKAFSGSDHFYVLSQDMLR